MTEGILTIILILIVVGFAVAILHRRKHDRAVKRNLPSEQLHKAADELSQESNELRITIAKLKERDDDPLNALVRRQRQRGAHR